MNKSLKTTARGALRRVGLETKARTLWASRSYIGRRNLRDDRQLMFLLAATLGEASNCIDVGAAEGEILGEIVRLAPCGQHMAFEPRPEATAHLRETFPGVEVRNEALSDETGQTSFYLADTPQSSGLQQRDWLGVGYRTATVPVARLDDLVPPDRRIDFVKIDVEGAQVRVLHGAGRVLDEHHPALWFEHGDRSAAVHNTTREDLWYIMIRHDYRVFTADGEGPLSWEAFNTERIKRLWAFLAH